MWLNLYLSLGYFYIINIKLEITTKNHHKKEHRQQKSRHRVRAVWKAGSVQKEKQQQVQEIWAE